MTTRKLRGREWPKVVTVGHASVTIYRMAHETNASGYTFVLTWRTRTGRQRQKFSDEEAVMKEARLKATELSQGHIEAAGMTSSDRGELLAARKITGEIPLLSALAEWARVRDITDGHAIAAAEYWAARNVGTKHQRKKVADVVDEFLAAKARAKIRTEENHGHIFEDLKSAFGAQFIDAVSTPHLNVWLDRWESRSTRQTFRKHTVGLWRWAQRQNYLMRDATTEAERTENPEVGQPKRGTINAPTLRALLALIQKDHPEYLAPLVLATFCGLRRAEVHGQVWEHVDLVGRTLTVTKAKEGTPAERPVPIPPAAVAWLMQCGERKGPVCTNLAVDRIRDIGRTAEFELPENCFRHSFITYRCKLTTVAQVADEAGNSPAMIRKHYRNVLTDNRPMRKSEAKAWFESAPGKLADVVPMRKVASA